MNLKNYKLTIGWLYPELMSTYGDRGNILILQKRCALRNIDCTIVPIDFALSNSQLSTINFFFGGGAQDRQQGILIDDLRKQKGPVMKQMIDDGTPGLFVCGSPQLLGHSYMMGDGTTLEGLHIFDMETRHFGKDKPRCIGNMIVDIDITYQISHITYKNTVVGFENHGGRTYLGKGVKPFGTVIVGYGNNGEDKTEGAVYRNCIATYSHGPFLAKNPHIADYLIATILEHTYKKTIPLLPLDDTLEWQAHDAMLERLKKT